jgi:hypothetical protein
MTASASAKGNLSPARAIGTSIAAALAAATTCEGTAFIGLTLQQRCEKSSASGFSCVPLTADAAASPRQWSRAHIAISERNSIFRRMQVNADRPQDWLVSDRTVLLFWTIAPVFLTIARLLRRGSKYPPDIERRRRCNLWQRHRPIFHL